MVGNNQESGEQSDARMIQPIRQIMVVRVWPDEEVTRAVHSIGPGPLRSEYIMATIPWGGRIEISAL